MSLYTKHNIPLTESQISIICYTLEDYMARGSGNTSSDPDLPKEVDDIIELLEGTVDKYYDKVEKNKAKQPTMEWDDGFTHYSECVDKLVDDMNSSESVTPGLTD